MSAIGELRLNLQLVAGSQSALEPEAAMVLAAVERSGSISGAGRDIGMSYRKTWMVVDSLNRSWSQCVIETKPDAGPRGARLTPFGQRLLATYQSLEARLMKAASGADVDWLLASMQDGHGSIPLRRPLATRARHDDAATL